MGVKASTVNTASLSEAQRGYIAAFLDGEGGIQITRSERKDREYTLALHPGVYFTLTNEEAVRTIRNWLGGGSITRRREQGNHRDTYVLTVSGVRSILSLLTAIRPLLIIKRRRANLIMEFCRSRISNHRGKGRNYTKDDLRLKTPIRHLNHIAAGA